MRQKCLEVSSPLMVPGVGLVDTGDEFDAPLLVPGCVSLEPPEDTPDEGESGTGDGGGDGEQDKAQKDQPAARSRARNKESGQ